MTTDIVSFIRARLDEDERLARAVAGSGCWSKYIEGGDDGAAIESDPGGDPGAIIGDEAMAEHMARHDPVRVLAEVEAKRRILDLRDAWVAAMSPAPSADLVRRFGDQVHAADMFVRLLALSYADHPEYDESWRPE